MSTEINASIRVRKSIVGLLFALVAGQGVPVLAQEALTETDRRLIAALESYVPQVMRQHNTPGLNLAVARRGKVIWEKGFGFADLEREIPMAAHTVMRSGSMGRTYTATAVMQLVERGIMGLHDPINKHLTDFQVHNHLGEREITVYDLMTHRSGLTSGAAGSEFAVPKPLGEFLRDEYAEDMFESYDRSLLPRWSAKVGERFQYSNFGIATLGYLVEVTNPDGLSFSEYVQRHIMDPLGMTSSQYPPVQNAEHVRPDIYERMSTGYARFGPVHIPTPAIYFGAYPAGTVVTTPGDHVKLLLAYLNDGTYNGYQLLEPHTVRLMLGPRAARTGPMARLRQQQEGIQPPVIGLVWFLSDQGQPNFSFGHGGAHMFGWRNDFRAYPNFDAAVAVATNHWDMVSPSYGIESSQIVGFVGEWMAREKENLSANRPERSWSWKTSYVMGLIMVEQLVGGLGIKSPLTSDAVDAMVRGARVRTEAENGESVWNEAGFRAGVDDMLSVEMTAEAIFEFMGSDRLQVAPEELRILYDEIGGTGRLIPWPEFVPQ